MGHNKNKPKNRIENRIENGAKTQASSEPKAEPQDGAAATPDVEITFVEPNPSKEVFDRNAFERNYWLHVTSPLHVGAGRGVGYIDLPIVREKVTNWPYVPGSAVKGVIADQWNAAEERRNSDPHLAAAFGTAGDNAQAGSLVFSDASIVCLPVRSFYGTFAWITSPMVLNRLRCAGKPDVPFAFLNAAEVLVLDGNRISADQDGNTIPAGQNAGVYKVYLEDIDLTVRNVEEDVRQTLGAWGELLARSVFPGNADRQTIFKQRFALVSDDMFTFFCEAGTEVVARIRINDAQKVVEDGALWYEESLPTETILAGVVWCDRVFGDGKLRDGELSPKNLMESFCRPCDLQIGGKASIGRGQVHCVFSGGGQ
jgi:CRISPR-associated protein Cmr4